MTKEMYKTMYNIVRAYLIERTKDGADFYGMRCFENSDIENFIFSIDWDQEKDMDEFMDEWDEEEDIYEFMDELDFEELLNDVDGYFKRMFEAMYSITMEHLIRFVEKDIELNGFSSIEESEQFLWDCACDEIRWGICWNVLGYDNDEILLFIDDLDAVELFEEIVEVFDWDKWMEEIEEPEE